MPLESGFINKMFRTKSAAVGRSFKLPQPQLSIDERGRVIETPPGAGTRFTPIEQNQIKQMKQLGFVSGEEEKALTRDQFVKSVRGYQKSAGLSVDGVAGERTTASLDSRFPPAKHEQVVFPPVDTVAPPKPFEAMDRRLMEMVGREHDIPSDFMPAQGPSLKSQIDPNLPFTLSINPPTEKVPVTTPTPQPSIAQQQIDPSALAAAIGPTPAAPGLRDISTPASQMAAPERVEGVKPLDISQTISKGERVTHALAQPSVQQALLQAGAAFDPKGFAGQLNQQFSPAIQGQMFNNYLKRLNAGEDPGSITGPDVDGLIPELISEATSQYRQMQLQQVEMAKAPAETRLLDARSALLEITAEEFVSPAELQRLERLDRIEAKKATDALSIIKSTLSAISPDEFEGDDIFQALIGGQKLLTPNQELVLKEAVKTLQGLKQNTFGLYDLFFPSDKPTLF